jgi:hypothetical protein
MPNLTVRSAGTESLHAARSDDGFAAREVRLCSGEIWTVRQFEDAERAFYTSIEDEQEGNAQSNYTTTILLLCNV